ERVVDLPIRVQTDRIQIILLFVSLLFEAEVLAAARQLMQNERGLDDAVIEHDAIERTVALHPDGLLATIFRQLLLREGVVESEGQCIGRRKLEHSLTVDALTLEVRERVTDVVRDTVELAVGGPIVDIRSRTDRAIRHVRIPGADVPVVDG